MKKTPLFLALAAVGLALTTVDLRATDQVPPVPPGNSLPPPVAPSSKTTPSSIGSSLQTTGKNQAGAPGDRRVEKLKKELGLTAAQVAKIKPIIERTAQQMKTLRSSVAVSPAQRKQQMRQILTASFQQIRPILTPQQLQKWKQIREEHRGQTQTAST